MSDLIEREDAIRAVGEAWGKAYRVIDALKSIPSAEPSVGYVGVDDDYLVSVKEVLNITAETGALETQRRVKELPRRDRTQGEWINLGGYEVCKNCHEVKRFPHWNFCPNCGAKMKGAEDE